MKIQVKSHETKYQRRQTNTPTRNNTQLTNVTLLSLPARLADAGPVVALAVLLAARMACSLVARRTDPTVLALALAL